MMELDDLKNTWQQYSKAQEEQHQLDAEQIRHALEKRTFTPAPPVAPVRRPIPLPSRL